MMGLLGRHCQPEASKTVVEAMDGLSDENTFASVEFAATAILARLLADGPE